MRSFQKKLMVAAASAAAVGAFGVAWAQSTDSSATTDTSATAPANGNMSGDAQSVPQSPNSPDMNNLHYPNDSSTVPNDASSPDNSAAPATTSTDNSSTDNSDASMPAPRADRN